MKTCVYVPGSLRAAGAQLRASLRLDLSRLPRQEFVQAWCSIAYLFPGLHPDGFEADGSGWPEVLRRYAREAWRRAEGGELQDEQLYASDSQWAGLYDRILVHLPEETERRAELAAQFGR